MKFHRLLVALTVFNLGLLVFLGADRGAFPGTPLSSPITRGE